MVKLEQMIGSRTCFMFNPIKSGRVYKTPFDIDIDDLTKDAEDFEIKVLLSLDKKEIAFRLPTKMLRKM